MMSENSGSVPPNEETKRDQPLILVVEDVPVIHDVIELSLRSFHAEYEFHTDGTAAVAWLDGNNPDLVVLDIALPGTDGWEIIKHMRADPRMSSIPVVVVTAHGPGIEQEIMELGANAYVDKPFLPSTLRTIVGDLLNRP